MKLVVAPNALKGALSADAAAAAIARGLSRAAPDVEIASCPIADGGDGTAHVLVRAVNGRVQKVPVHDALGRPREASFGELGSGRAVFDVASATGLGSLRRDELDVLAASSRGSGELALAALRRGAQHLVVGVGGSASVDGGIGFLAALGVQARDASGKELASGARGLRDLARFDASGLVPEARRARWTVLCDVDAPLAGALGFAPQKGARDEDLPGIAEGLARLAHVLGEEARFPGAGAAGGIPATLVALLGAEAVAGSDYVLDAIGFDEALLGAKLVISAEGSFDAQSSMNKGPVAVARRARAHGVPTIVLAGAVNTRELGGDVAAVLSITREPCALDHARKAASDWLALTAEQALRVFLLGESARAET